MPLVISSEVYNGINLLTGNAGDWITAESKFSCRFSVGSGTSNTIRYYHIGSLIYFEIQSGDFGQLGFLAGDSITCTYNFFQLPVPFQSQTFTTTITYISGNQMFIADPFTLNPQPPFFPPGWEHPNGRIFPTDNVVNGILIVADKEPDSIDIEFNLAPNGSTSLNSIIDAELNRFRLYPVVGLTPLTPYPMTQLGNKSGGYYKDVELTLMGTPGAGWRDYKVTYKFFQYGIIKDGFPEPNYYDSADCIAPIVKATAFAQLGNPNAIMTDKSENVEANTGGYDENYNGGLSLYGKESISWFDSLGNPIDKLDYSGTSTFVAVVNAPGQNNPLSTYRLGLVWRPTDDTYYKNLPDNIAQNLLALIPEVDFIADGVVVPGPFLGETSSTGARWDFANIKFELTGVDELTITGTIIPNIEANDLFANIVDGGRKSTLWVSIGDYLLDNTTNSKRVSLKLEDQDNYDAPTIGVQIPNVISQELYDHGVNIITLPEPQTTTEDDVLYISELLLIDGVQYEGIRTRIEAFNTVNEESFVLEENYFSFNNVPQISGQFQPDFLLPRGFNLPPSTDRNWISVKRKASLDVPGFYGIEIQYGYLSDWRYWLQQSNVNNDFFDLLLASQFYGKNKNWQRFYSGDWVIRLSYFTRVAGVDDFNHQEIGIRPYEDDADVTTNVSFLVLSNGTTPNDLVANELIEITAVLTWATGAYTNWWAEITYEDFEAGNRWVISDQLPQGNVNSNPLKPIAGQVGLQTIVSPVNVITMKCLIDTSILSANKGSLSYRIYSDDEPIPPAWEFLLNVNKEAVGAYSVARKLSPDSIYSGALIRVRRGLDNAEMDIPYIFTGGEYVLDEVALLAFTGDQIDDWGWVVTRYDQSGLLNHAVQPIMSAQAPIVQDGVVLKDLDTNRPAMYCNGTTHYERLSAPILVTQQMVFATVFNRQLIGSGFRAHFSFASDAGTFPYSMLWLVNLPSVGIIYDGLDNLAPNNVHFVGQTQYGAQLNVLWRNGINETRMRLNGVDGNVLIVPNTGGTLTRLQFANAGGGYYHEGPKSEDVGWGLDNAFTPAQIEANINNFYNVF